MEIINADVVTGTKIKDKQITWFQESGFRYAINAKGKVFTTDDWMNLKDKGTELELIDNDKPWLATGLTPNEWLEVNAIRFLQSPFDLPYFEINDDNHQSSIYFLFADGEIVYIGKSVETGKRFLQHLKDGKEWDYARVLLGVPKFYMEHIEMLYIHEFQPILNVKYLPVAEPLKKYLGMINEVTL